MGYRQAVPDETDVEMGPDGGFGGEPLSRWQRVASCVLGLGGVGAGGASVFMTSNQAGSVALLGVGAGFLIMAVNGTPIIRAKLKDYELTMAPRRRKVVEIALSEPPEEASRTLDVLQQIDPGARTDPGVLRAMGDVYDAEVLAALKRAALGGPGVTVDYGQSDLGVDLLIRSQSKVIYVAVKYSTAPEGPLPASFIRKVFADADRRTAPLMVVTNRRLSNQISELAKSVDPEGQKVQFVRWRDRQDDLALKLALIRLLEAQDGEDR